MGLFSIVFSISRLVGLLLIIRMLMSCFVLFVWLCGLVMGLVVVVMFISGVVRCVLVIVVG